MENLPVINSIDCKLLTDLSNGLSVQYRYIWGARKTVFGVKIGRFYDKCSESLQIPLRKIFNPGTCMHGHVGIGFTEDGKYFLTYLCDIKFQVTDTSACSYQYKLFWWKFDLWKPLKKVREVRLFANEQIPNEVHLMVCQENSSFYMIVHGSMISTDSQSNGKMCYLSVIPKCDSKELENCLHFKYELLPPHPPFCTSLSLKLPNTILMNTGDMLIAVLLDDLSRTECSSSDNIQYNTENVNVTNNVASHCSPQKEFITNRCYCSQKAKENVDLESDASDDESRDFISFIRQGYSSRNADGPNSTLSNSPFDCTATVIPCTITPPYNDNTWRNVFEHRCYRANDKGYLGKCEYYVSQAQFDAENFMNSELQRHHDISKRMVSLKDYDMQLVEVCPWTNEVVILINALVVLHDPLKNEQSLPKVSFFESFQSQRSMKLVLYSVGYILSWNVVSGAVKTLKQFPLAEGAGNICKTRQFNPSFAQAVQLKKKWFVPNNKTSSVHVLSNHTVFTGQSLEFLFHPEFPVAVVL